MKVKHEILLEAGDHFLNGYEKDPQQRGDLQLYGGTPLAKELWAEWLPIYVGISDILSKIKDKLSQTNGGTAAAKSASYFIDEIKKVQNKMISALEDSDQNGQEKLLLTNVNEANNLLKKIHKFIETSNNLFTKEERAEQEREAELARKKAKEKAEKAKQTSEETKGKLGEISELSGQELTQKVAEMVKSYAKEGRTYSILTGQDRTRADALAEALRDCFDILNSKADMAKFIKLLDSLVRLEDINPRHYENLVVLAESMKKGRLYTNKDNPIFEPRNIEVFSQHRADFNYTVELFNLLMTKQLEKLLGKLTPKVYDMFTRSLYNGNDPSNKIKKAGFFEKDKSEKTLYGTVTIFSNVQRGVGGRKANDQGQTGTVRVGDASMPGFNHIPKTITAAKNAEKINVNGVFTYNKEKRAWEDSKGTVWRPEMK